MRLVDVNVLVNVINSDSPHHPRLLEWWNKALASSTPIGLTWPVLIGLVRITTKANILPQPLTPAEALTQTEEWVRHPNVNMLSESEQHWPLFADLVREAGRGGDIVHDAHLAAIAIGNGAVLASCDTDFARFGKLRWENPLAAA